jgi:hypothetical protein
MENDKAVGNQKVFVSLKAAMKVQELIISYRKQAEDRMQTVDFHRVAVAQYNTARRVINELGLPIETYELRDWRCERPQ